MTLRSAWRSVMPMTRPGIGEEGRAWLMMDTTWERRRSRSGGYGFDAGGGVAALDSRMRGLDGEGGADCVVCAPGSAVAGWDGCARSGTAECAGRARSTIARVVRS